MDHLCPQSGTAPHPPKASFWLLTSSQPVKGSQENVQTPQCGPPRAHVIRPLLPHLVFLTDFFSSSHAPPSPSPSLLRASASLCLFPLSIKQIPAYSPGNLSWSSPCELGVLPVCSHGTLHSTQNSHHCSIDTCSLVSILPLNLNSTWAGLSNSPTTCGIDRGYCLTSV